MTYDGASIVLVEDNESDAEIARRAIERATPVRNLMVVEDGLTAAEMFLAAAGEAKRYLPKLMLIDINLPGLGGLELLRRIRNSPQLRHIAVVMVSSSTDERDIRTA